MDTSVVIVGAGPAGLTLANLLWRSGIDCVVLEKQSRSYVERRQRAGILDHRSASIFEEWGLAEQVLAGAPSDTVIEIRVDGVPRYFDVPGLAGGKHSRLLPQQFVVQRLLDAYVDGGGDLRTDANDVALHRIEGDRPVVTYRDAAGEEHRIECEYIAGCDGHHGVTRQSIPEQALTTYSYDHGIGWLTVLADAPAPRYPLFAVSRHGFAAQFARGPRASRYYLQRPPSDAVTDWPDDRVWEQLRVRLGDPDLPAGPVTEKALVEMRSFVVDPMSYGRLYLVGDAAHIITPMGGKGMNLALADADVLAKALAAALKDGDDEALRSYSATCLRRTWDYQEFSRWMQEMMHDAGDDTVTGPFRRELARARLDRLFTSPAAATLFATMMSGAD
ncbi:4-hydroxybenzoate 3-monooxygenase [Micromonospora sp. CPCC 205371]|nr:4-hydroxybenzoate 3-monooxygenase [Micromonospora sp. CPCC 205371]